MTSLPLWASIPASILLVLSGLITLTGSVGILRFKRFYSRMHAATLGNTMGVACLLIASIVVASAVSHRFTWHELLIALFLATASPVTAILLMQAAVRRDPRRPLDSD